MAIFYLFDIQIRYLIKKEYRNMEGTSFPFGKSHIFKT